MKGKQEVTRRAPLTDMKKQMMLAVLIRHKVAFLMAQTQLKPAHFGAADQPLAVVWASVLDFYLNMGRLPKEAELIAEMEERLQTDPDCLTESQVADADQFVARAFAVKRKDLSPALAAKHLRTFLEDTLAEKAREIFHVSSRTPGDMFQVASQIAQEASLIQSVSGVGIEAPFPQGWDTQEPPVIKRETGIKFLDAFLNGGDAEGEVYGLLGPFGSCKTTTLVQLSTLRADQLYREWEAKGKKGPLPVVYYFFYEASMAEMRVRAISCSGQLDRTVVERGAWSELSTSDADLKDYERKLYANSIANGTKVVPGIRRKRSAEIRLQRNWRAIDMTGNDPQAPGRGYGGIMEVVALIQQNEMFHKAKGTPICCGGIYLDYLGAMVDAFLTHSGAKKRDEFRFEVKGAGRLAKNRLALAFKCPVWMAHQLSGEGNALPPGMLPKYTDASEGKAFAENLDFCIEFGTKNTEMLCAVGCDKARRAPLVHAQVVYINGQISRVQTAKGYVIDPTNRRIASADDVSRVGGGTRKKSRDGMPDFSAGMTQSVR